MSENIEEQIKNVLEKIRPFLQNDGGDIEFVNYEDGIVYVRVLGACVDCVGLDETIKEGVEMGMLDENFHCTPKANELYSFVRTEDIAELNQEVGLKRLEIIAADGAANYIRPYLNALDETEFAYFIQYHLTTCERAELLGASGHLVDILQK